MKLKPIRDQVVVVFGASSGIGRDVALRFGERGAKVVVAARSEDGLESLVDEIERKGGKSAFVTCDVADPAQAETVADTAVRTFGRIDTWVNVAAVSVYARAEDTTPEEFRRVMEVNYLGQVHGALAALPRLRQTGRGALIAVSSVESIVSLPLHSAYSASKHAVEGFIDALRRELMAEGAPISVTSVKPGTINTPFFNNSRNKMDVKPMGPPPIYQPGVVTDCVLFAAEHPVRDLFAGGAAKMMATGQMIAPGLVDAFLARAGIPSERTDQPEPGGAPGTLTAARVHDNRTEGDFSDQARRFSLYTWLETHPQARTLAVGGLLAGTAYLLSRKGRDGAPMRRTHQNHPNGRAMPLERPPSMPEPFPRDGLENGFRRTGVADPLSGPSADTVPAAGPHADPKLMNDWATPGAGALTPGGRQDDMDSTSG